MDGHMDLLLDGIGSWHLVGNLHDLLHLVGNVFDHRIGLWHLDLNGHMDVLLDGHMYDLLDGHGHWHLLNDGQCLLLVHREVRHVMMVIVLVVVQSSLRLGRILASRCLGSLGLRLSLLLLGGSGGLLVLSSDVAGGQEQDQSQRCRCAL